MPTRGTTLAFAAAAAALLVRADDPFTFCTDAACGDCPVSLTTAGTGYPGCVVYNTNDVFLNHGFGTSPQGGYKPYIDIPEQGPDCKVIIKSPADTSIEGCGYQIAHYVRATCATLSLDTTFMVQFCCGSGDCTAAGVGKRSVKYRQASGSSPAGAMYLRDANGTTIKPITVGSMDSTGPPRVKKDVDDRQLSARGNCEKNSWIADPGQEDYTRPADGSQLMLTGVSGPQTVTITHERSQSYTSTLEASIGFEDIVSLGMSFSQSMTKEESESTSRAFQVVDGQSGDVAFTPFLRCTTGTGTCHRGQLSGEVCTPYKDGSGKMAGEYSITFTS